MPHKIAIIRTNYSYSSYYDDEQEVVRSITDWATVSHEDFELLKKAQLQQSTFEGKFYVLEQVTETEEFVKQTVESYLQQVRAKKEEEDARKQAAAAKRAEQALKKLAKTEEAERQLLANLQKKYTNS